MGHMSLPLRECGLKFLRQRLFILGKKVTPFAGVWIEIPFRLPTPYNHQVTPFAGVWIEISSGVYSVTSIYVTPFAGVWIEICHL